MRAHLARPLAAARSQLNARLQNVQGDNERLFAEVESQRKEIDELLAELEAAGVDVDLANELLAEVVDEVAREARDVEIEMGGAGH